MVFDANGQMIGRVGIWEHDNEWNNYNNGSEFTVQHTSTSFNFNDADWNNINVMKLGSETT